MDFDTVSIAAGFEKAAIVRQADDIVPATHSFLEITRNAPESLVRQLVGRDGVHAIGNDTVENIRQFRLGGDGRNRACYALINAQGRPDSVIFVHRLYHAIEKPRDLSGNVVEILTQETKANNATPTGHIFYSICNHEDAPKGIGIGGILIRRVHAELTREHPQSVLSTLSPLRKTFDKHVEQTYGERFAGLSAEQRMLAAYSHLLDIGNEVQKFHMLNGAVIGEVWANADSQGVNRYMVNYIYDRDPSVLADNGKKFKALQRESIGSLMSAELSMRMEQLRPGIIESYRAGTPALQIF